MSNIVYIATSIDGGVPLFGDLSEPLKFRHTKAERYLDYLVKSYYVRQR